MNTVTLNHGVFYKTFFSVQAQVNLALKLIFAASRGSQRSGTCFIAVPAGLIFLSAVLCKFFL